MFQTVQSLRCCYIAYCCRNRRSAAVACGCYSVYCMVILIALRPFICGIFSKCHFHFDVTVFTVLSYCFYYRIICHFLPSSAFQSAVIGINGLNGIFWANFKKYSSSVLLSSWAFPSLLCSIVYSMIFQNLEILYPSDSVAV